MKSKTFQHKTYYLPKKKEDKQQLGSEKELDYEEDDYNYYYYIPHNTAQSTANTTNAKSFGGLQRKDSTIGKSELKLATNASALLNKSDSFTNHTPALRTLKSGESFFADGERSKLIASNLKKITSYTSMEKIDSTDLSRR